VLGLHDARKRALVEDAAPVGLATNDDGRRDGEILLAREVGEADLVAEREDDVVWRKVEPEEAPERIALGGDVEDVVVCGGEEHGRALELNAEAAEELEPGRE
jgi:hypothetical protein